MEEVKGSNPFRSTKQNFHADRTLRECVRHRRSRVADVDPNRIPITHSRFVESQFGRVASESVIAPVAELNPALRRETRDFAGTPGPAIGGSASIRTSSLNGLEPAKV
jgi:hypothetical protein